MYCCVDEAYHKIVTTPLRSLGFAPNLTDSELITMEIVGEFMGKDCDEGIWRYFKNHRHNWFPKLGSRSSFVEQSAPLLILRFWWSLEELKNLPDIVGKMADDVKQDICESVQNIRAGNAAKLSIFTAGRRLWSLSIVLRESKAGPTLVLRC